MSKRTFTKQQKMSILKEASEQGVTETINFFKDNVEKDVKRIMDNWMLGYEK